MAAPRGSPAAATEDPYFKKTVGFEVGGLELKLRVSQTLFSSHAVDAGTELLVRALHDTGAGFEKVLDPGCGYGPIGIALKALNPGAALHMTDRDALAVRYARENALLNGIEDALAYPSLGFDDIRDRDFDLVAANIAGKAGERVIASWLRDAPLLLRAGGLAGIVVVSPLEPLVNGVIDGLPGAEVVLRRRRGGHSVFLYRAGQTGEGAPGPAGSFGQGQYDRAQAPFSHGQVEYRMNTVFGLPEFDSLSYRTQLLCSVLNLDPHPFGKLRAGSNPLPSRERGRQAGDRVLVLNPGQGHVPVILSKALAPASIDMVDRDLLSLRCSARNLGLNGFEASRMSTTHRADLGGGEPTWDLVAAGMRDEEGPDAMAMHLRQAMGRLAPGGRLVVAADSGSITRLAGVCKKERLGPVVQRKRRRGSSVLVVAG